MHGARRGVVAALTLVVVLATVTPLVGVASGTTAAPVRNATVASAAQVTDGDSIRQTQTYALTPSTPGEVRVTLTYEIPDRVVSLETQVPGNVTVTDVDGFDRVNESAFEWDETTAVATIAYRTNPNETLETTGPEADSGTYVNVDAGEWALFQRSRTPTRWRYTGTDPVRFEREVTADGPGAAGDDLVYLGEQETASRTAHGQTVRLVVPAASSLRENRSAILDAIANASDALRVGDRDTSVFVVAAPTGEVEWAVRGLQTGDADLWVQDTEPLDTAENVWIHEYVHSRQRFRTTAESRWFTEASAVYYAALLTLEQDRIDFEAFEARMSEGEREVYDSVVLTDPSTWEQNPDYHRGALVAGRVDERVRVASDSERTLQDTFRLLNGLDQPVTQAGFLAAVERAGNESVRSAAADLTEQRTDVTMWDQTRHAAVFEQLPARIGYGLPPTDEAATYNVTGPYRETRLDGSGPIRLATGETLTLEAVVSNAGGTEGGYNATLAINGTEVATKGGRIEPGEEVLVPLSHRFVTPGRYQMSVDGDNVTVLVERPARARVTGIEVSTRTADQGDIVVVTASVVNDAEIPGEVLVVFTRDFQSVAERQVYLPPGNTTEVSTGVTVPEPGEVLLSAGEARAVTVSVTPAQTQTRPTTTTSRSTPPTTSSSETTGGSAPGFTLALTVLALALAALLTRRR